MTDAARQTWEGVGVSAVEVVGLSADGTQVLLRVGEQTVELPLEDVRRAERRAQRWGATTPVSDEPLTPRLVQHRIRCGETAADIARDGGWTVEAVARWEGPPLAEREHHASQARVAEVDGMRVEDLVAGHLRLDPDAVEWDAWLVDEGRWEVRAHAAGQSLRLRWDPAGRRVQALDEPGRRVLRVAGVQEDLLTAVLRPVADNAPPAARPAPEPRPRRARAEIPLWADISSQVTGREHPEQ